MASTPACAASRCAPGPTCCCARSPSRGAWRTRALAGYAMYFDLQDAEQRTRTGAVEDPPAPAAGVVRAARPRRQPLGCAADRRAARRRRAAGARRRSTCARCRCRNAAERRRASPRRRTSAATTSPSPAQLTARRPRDRRRRHAPGPARAEHLVPRAIALSRCTRAAAAASTSPASPCPACRRWWSAATATSPGASPTAMATGSTGQCSDRAVRRRRCAGVVGASRNASRRGPEPTSILPSRGNALGPGHGTQRRRQRAGAALGRAPARFAQPRPGRFACMRDSLDDALQMADSTRDPGAEPADRRPQRRASPGAWLGPMPHARRRLRCRRTVDRRTRPRAAPWPITHRRAAPRCSRRRAAAPVDRQRARRRRRRCCALIGDGGYAHWARARSRSATTCSRSSNSTERDLLAIQLDDRALFLQRAGGSLLRDAGRAREVTRAAANSPRPPRPGRAAPAPIRSATASCARGGWPCTTACSMA